MHVLKGDPISLSQQQMEWDDPYSHLDIEEEQKNNV